MTRKHYVEIAAALARTRPAIHVPGTQGEQVSPYWEQWRVTRDAIASVLQHDNPRFDRARFFTATEA